MFPAKVQPIIVSTVQPNDPTVINDLDTIMCKKITDPPNRFSFTTFLTWLQS